MKEIIIGMLILITAIGIIYLLSRIQMMAWTHQLEHWLKDEFKTRKLQKDGDSEKR
jgi:hypothetical protein